MFKNLIGVASASLLAFAAYGCDSNKEETEYDSAPAKTSETARDSEKQAHRDESDARNSKRKSEQRKKDHSKDENYPIPFPSYDNSPF